MQGQIDWHVSGGVRRIDHPYAEARRISSSIERTLLACSCALGTGRKFRVDSKLAPQYVGPYKVLGQCGLVAYRLQLLDILSVVHDVFHVSQLKKCLRIPNEAMEIEGLPL